MFNYRLLNDFYEKYVDDNLKIRKPIIKELNYFDNINAMDIVAVKRVMPKKTLIQTVITTYGLPYKFELVEYLVCNGHDINQKDSSGNDALHYALCRGDIDITNMIFCYKDYNIDVNKITNYMNNISIYKTSDMFELLRLKGGKLDPNTVIDRLNEGLVDTIYAESYINILLHELKCDINYVTPQGHNIIFGLIYSKHYDLAKNLVEKYPKLDLNVNPILHLLVPYPDIMFYFIDKGANINCVTAQGMPLIHNLMQGCLSIPNFEEVVDKLIDKGLDVNAKCLGINTFVYCFYRVVNVNNYETLMKLADKFTITPSEINSLIENQTLLQKYFWKGIKLRPYYYDRNQQTLVIDTYHIKMTVPVMKYLISKGADYNMLDANKKSVQQYCEEAKIWNEIIN